MDKLELHDCWGSSFAELHTKGELALPSLAGGNLFAIADTEIALPEEPISISETDLRKCLQKVSHYRCRFFLVFYLVSIADTDFGLKRVNSVIISATTAVTNFPEKCVVGK